MFHRRGCRDAQKMAVQAAFAEELAGLEHADHRFLAVIGQYREFDLAFLDVVNRVGGVALFEDRLAFLQFQDRLASSHFGEEHLRVERILGWQWKSPLRYAQKLDGSACSVGDRTRAPQFASEPTAAAMQFCSLSGPSTGFYFHKFIRLRPKAPAT
jgi:hypothetical protein